MKQEEKQLLSVDLCARLPYGIKCTTKLTGYNDVYAVQGVYGDTVFIDCPIYGEGDDEWMIESIIPFLRPMSSMTEEEREEFKSTKDEEVVNQYPCSAAPNEIKILSYTAKTFDWLNKKHFDYRGLISKGLALKAPEGMYSV